MLRSLLRKTRLHLDYLHLQILSVVTAQQLKKMFERRTNFDLRRLLGGRELTSEVGIVGV